MNIQKANKKLNERFGNKVHCEEKDGCIFVSGQLDNWEDVVEACTMCSTRYSKTHVVNDIEFTGAEIPATRQPKHKDKSLNNDKPDVLIIGGGITGASLLRELMKYDIDALLVEKEADLALHATGRNDGQVHPGVDLGKGNLKHEYVLKGNAIYGDVCKELGVDFKRVGQYGSIIDKFGAPLLIGYALQRKYMVGVKDTKILSKKELYKLDPNLNPGYKIGMYNPSCGVVSPYELTIAYGENAIQNGARISLNTFVSDMEVENGIIKSVTTNRGVIYPKVVVNCAGTFAEDVAKMAQDRFFSIHPRKGTNSITDRKVGNLVDGVTSVKAVVNKGPKNTKGGGIIHTIHDNLLIGPDAIETYEKENFATEKSSIDSVFEKQRLAVDKLNQKDIITYFTGVRAATFEEDFILERGRKTKNIVHLAGIQSPGLTAAPAFSKDMAELVKDVLSEQMEVKVNEEYDPIREPIPCLKKMSDEERDAMIKQNPDYGIIVCRCEEISKGEILDCLKSPLCVPTVDGIKKRVRPGMGRCQGGFCMPQIVKIISDYMDIPEEEVLKTNERAFISFGKTKGGDHE